MSLKLSGVLCAGQTALDVVVKKKGRRYSSAFSKDGKPVKLSLERIDDHDFTRAFLQCYYFRQSDKEYGAHRQVLARLGFHAKDPIVMEYRDQKYVQGLQVKLDGAARELQLFYSPVTGHLVVRAAR